VGELSTIGTAESFNRVLIDAIGRNRHRLIIRGSTLSPTCARSRSPAAICR
jgi:hypothetical protein